jgi:hypothetical protein
MVIRLTIFSVPLNQVSCDVVLVVMPCDLVECAARNVDVVGVESHEKCCSTAQRAFNVPRA